MNMTREDVLRELELLPVWRLNPHFAGQRACATTVQPEPATALQNAAPVSTPTQPQTIAPVLMPVLEVAEFVAQPTPPASTNLALICTISDDKKWAFIWPADRAPIGLQSSLFSNILMALCIQKTHTSTDESMANVQATVIVAMGEVAAQQLLKSAEPIESLRGKTHQLENTSLIVTYHPSDLLQNLHLKANAWHDLCRAMCIVNT